MYVPNIVFWVFIGVQLVPDETHVVIRHLLWYPDDLARAQKEINAQDLMASARLC